jgi:hypothetical protein
MRATMIQGFHELPVRRPRGSCSGEPPVVHREVGAVDLEMTFSMAFSKRRLVTIVRYIHPSVSLDGCMPSSSECVQERRREALGQGNVPAGVRNERICLTSGEVRQ